MCYSEFEELKETGVLDKIMVHNDIPNELKKDVEEFFGILDSDYYKNKPALKKEKLYQTNLIKIYRKYDYQLDLYFNMSEAYRIFPKFILGMAKIYDVPKYSTMNFNEILFLLNKNIDLVKKHDYNWDRDFIEIMPRLVDYKYRDYDFTKTKPDFNDKKNFSVFAEVDTYNEECDRLKDVPGSIVNHTAATLGDGFGYDVYSYDPNSDREKLIEVKSGKYSRVELSLKEFETLYRTKEQPKTDYYIYRY